MRNGELSYDAIAAANMEEMIEKVKELTAINADLLAALERLSTHEEFVTCGLSDPNSDIEVWRREHNARIEFAKSAIAKTKDVLSGKRREAL